MHDLRVINQKQDDAAIREAARAELDGNPVKADDILHVLSEEKVPDLWARWERELARLKGVDRTADDAGTAV